MAKARVFVTGGAGYIGSHVVKLLGENGYEVLTYDNLSTGHRWAVLYGDLVEGDILDYERLLKALKDFRPNAVIHFAALIVVPESVRDPLRYYQNNVVGTINLLRAMKASGVRKLVFSSSAAVYGVPKRLPIPEDHPLEPINPYGETKATVERILRDIKNSDEPIKWVSLRYFNVAGADPDGKIGFAYPEPTHLIIRALKAAKGEIPMLEIYGTDYPTSDGTCIRDYIHVVDLADAHLLALEHLLDGGESMALNCGYGRGYSVREVVESVKRVTGVDFPIVEAPRRPGDPPSLVADSSLIKKIFGWTPQFEDLELIIKTGWEWEKKLDSRKSS